MPEAATDQATSALRTTRLITIAAIGLTPVAVFGDGVPSVTTVVCGVVILVSWLLIGVGVELPPCLFLLLAGVPGAVIVVVEQGQGGMFPLMLLVVWMARAPVRWPYLAAAVGTSLGAITALAIRVDSSHDVGLVFFYGGTAISWLAGALLRRQEALNAEVRAMRDVDVARLAADERARIAREVHDVVAHSLTVVMLNVTGARRALATHPERVDEALARAEIVGRDSLDSIRQVMGLLREPGPAAALPAPTLAAIPALVDGYRAAGLAVDLALDGEDVPLDPTVELVAYRLVQESLANVLQHAPGTSATVDVRNGPVVLTVTVENGPPDRAAAPSERTGLGTRGMAERVRAVGGTFTAGAASTGGWRVEAVVPVGAGADEVAWLTTPGTPSR